MDILYEELSQKNDITVNLLTMTGKKWHWRARTSALYFAQNIPIIKDLKCIFTSCVLPLHELIGLRPDLALCKKIVYFHENQLVYPVRKSKDRDFQYGYNQIMTCLTADVIAFNSEFNQRSFLENITKFFKLQPDYRPKNLREQIMPKCRVLYFPLKISSTQTDSAEGEDSYLRLVWPHRWEFDKNPEQFFRVLYELKKLGKVNFRVNVLGESFTDNPQIFNDAKDHLADLIENFGYVKEKTEYFDILRKSDIVISTASHEFFGVAMLEAVSCKCFPISPKDLVYPEIFPYKECLYDSEEDLLNRLMQFLDSPEMFRKTKDKFFTNFSLEKYKWENLKVDYFDAIIK